MIAVLAGNTTQFDFWAREKRPGTLRRRGYRDVVINGKIHLYIGRDSDVAGREFEDFIVVGTFWERHDADLLMNLVKFRLVTR